MPTRRAVLLGTMAAGAVAAGAGVERGILPGRPWVQAHLGLNGEDGAVPDVAPGPVEEDSFVSEARGGVRTGWSLLLPPDTDADGLPVVVALHGLGQDHATLTGPSMGLDRFLAAYAGPPYAIAAADGGTTYWHPRPTGEDAGAMVTDELLPRLADRGLDTGRIGLIGWSMGGYGALRLGGLLGPERVSALVACSPALWRDPDDASRSGFSNRAEYEEFSVYDDQADLDGIAVRVDCGTGDPFYRDVQHYVDGFEQEVTSDFEAGAHTTGYWRRMLPRQLEFLGAQQPQE